MPRAARRSWRPAGSGRPRPRREHEMAIFLTGESRILIQGITGSEGSKHGRRMLAAGTKVVGGTNPRKAGQTVDLGGNQIPVFGTVAETMAATGADVSVVFVPPAGTKSAVIEAIDAADTAGDRDHRGHPGARHRRVLGLRLRAGQRDPHRRPELPGRRLAGQVQRRDHPGRHHHRGPDRPGLQVGHADLPDDVRAARHRLLDRRRDRRRPGHRHHPHRLPARPSRTTRRRTRSS